MKHVCESTSISHLINQHSTGTCATEGSTFYIYCGISSLAIQLREASQTFGVFSRAACWRMRHWVHALHGQSSMKKCDVTRLYAKCKEQGKCNTLLHQAIRIASTIAFTASSTGGDGFFVHRVCMRVVKF